MTFYDVNAAIDKPNIVNSLRQGFMFGQQKREIEQQEADRNELRALAAPAASGDIAAQDRALAIDPQRGQQYMDTGARRAQQLGGYVKWVNEARARGNPQEINARVAAGSDFIRQLTGKPGPTAWSDDPAFLQGWNQLEARVAMSGAEGTGQRVQSSRIGADGNIYNVMADGTVVNTGVQADRQMWLRDHPGMDPTLVGKDGVERPIGGQVMPQGAPQGVPLPQPANNGDPKMDALVQAANAMRAAGVPVEQIDAWLQQTAQATPSVQVSPPGMVPTGAQPPAPQPAPTAPPLLRRRPSAAEEAAATEAAKRETALRYAPAETAAAAEREGALAAAKATAERNANLEKRGASAEDSLTLLDEAERLLPSSTGSGAGAIRDAAGNFVGASTPGAEAIASLKTIAGQLVAKMPRMEGPQSDRDVQMYRDMAGNLADPTIPVPQRMAALQTIRLLQEKYTDGPAATRNPANQGGQYQPGQVIEVNGKQYRVIGGDPNDPDVEEV